MTKTLTEQWREGTLPLGTYYILNINGDEEIDMSVAVGELWNNTDLEEVLAPIPSYDEWKQAKENLDKNGTWYTERSHKELLKQKERLQEQLKEANKLLLDFCSEDECRFDHNGYCQEHDSCECEYKCIQKDLKQYLEKWGVK